jgi:hypothetical protein
MTMLFLSLGIFEILFILLILLFPILALVDILKSKFDGHNKLIWVLVVIFTNTIGAILYFLIGKNQKIQE